MAILSVVTGLPAVASGEGGSLVTERGPMDITTIVGLIAGFTLVTMGILNGGALSAFIDVPSFLMTGGGTLAAYLIASPLHEAIITG